MVAKSHALKPGDKVIYLSPGSTPDHAAVAKRVAILESWGLQVVLGQHAFAQHDYLAGRDEDRLADLNGAIEDPSIRAIFATRGGKGSYRIADRMNFAALRNDPKLLVGFSDVTGLLLSSYHHCQTASIHGALFAREDDHIASATQKSLQRCIMQVEETTIHARRAEPTAEITTHGTAAGILIGGNLQLIATLVGWGLPDLTGKILLLEDVGQHPGQIDRLLTQLIKSGLLDGVAGIALGQFADCRLDGAMSTIEVLKEHVQGLSVPVLGGLPIGHGGAPVALPHGTMAHLNTSEGSLTIEPATY